MGTLASGSIDLKSLKAAGEPNKYVTFIDNTNGIRVHKAGEENSNFAQINSNGLQVYKGGQTDDYKIAEFGTTTYIGKHNNTQSYIQLDYHSLQMIDKEGDTYFYVSDLRNSNGIASITDIFWGDGSTKRFNLNVSSTNRDYSVTVSDSSGGTISKYTTYISFSTAPTNGAKITVVYESTSNKTKAYTIGMRNSNNTIGAYSVVEGYGNTASGPYSQAIGRYTQATGFASHAEGDYTVNNGTDQHTIAQGYGAHAEGLGTQAIGFASHSEGALTIANGSCSHAQGYKTQANGGDSHAEGAETIAALLCSHAEGSLTQALGSYCHAEGVETIAGSSTASSAHAEGWGSEATATTSHAQNYYTIAASQHQTAIGRYNISDSSNTYAFIIGNGNPSTRSNALTVGWDGNVNIASGAKYKINGTALSAADVGAVPTSRTINGKALTNNITIVPNDMFIFDSYSKAITVTGPGAASFTMGELTQHTSEGYTLRGYMNLDGGYTDQWLVSYGTYGANVVAMIYSKYTGQLNGTISCTAVWTKNS